MRFLLWVVPLLLIWPFFRCLRVMMVFRVLSGMRLGRDIIEPIAQEEIPRHMREALESWRKALEAAGFSFRQAWRGRAQYNPELALLYMEFTDAQGVVRAVFQRYASSARSGELCVRLCSTLADGREIITASYETEKILPDIALVSLVVMADAPFAQLYAEHLSRIRGLATAAVPLLDLAPEAALQHAQNLTDLSLETAVAQGVMERCPDGAYLWKSVPALKKSMDILRVHGQRTKADKKLRRSFPVVTLSAESQVDFDWENYVSFRALRRGQFNGKIKTVIAIVSLVLFSVAIAWETSFEIGLALVVALIVHEGGHLLAMRWFGHRDTQLVFIPFFGGAAVTNDDLVLKPWQQIVVLLMGPLPGLIGGLLLFIYTMTGSAGQWMVPAIVVMCLNLFNLLPILPLDGGQIFDVAVGSRFPKARIFFYGASAIALVAFSWLGGGGTTLFVLGLIMLWRIPVEVRQADLQEEVRSEATGLEEEPVVRQVLARLRDPLWKKTSMPQKLVLARTLQRKIRQPRPGWGTVAFALAAYTCPVWLVLPLVFLGWTGSMNRRVEAANARAAAAGLQLHPAPLVSQPMAEKDNAAPLVEQVEQTLTHSRASAEARMNSEPETRDTLPDSIALLRQAAHRPYFVPSRPETNATRRAHEEAVMAMAEAADNALAEDKPDEALALATDGLQLVHLLQQSPESWRWNSHALSTRQLWSKVEKATALVRPLSAKQLETLAGLADDAADLRFAQQGMAEEMLSSYSGITEMSSHSSNRERTLSQRFFGAVMGNSMSKTYGERVDTAIALKHQLANVQEGHWFVDTSKGGLSARLSQFRLEQLADHLAHLRLARAGLAVQWQMARTGHCPKSLAEVSSPWWYGAPHHPANGTVLHWNRSGESLVLSFEAKNPARASMKPQEDDEESDDEKESGLSWVIPVQAKS